MAHSITITDDKLYEQISGYCKLNGLKMNVFCTNLLKKNFKTEQFGDVPFGVMIDTETSSFEIPNAIQNHIQKRLDSIIQEQEAQTKEPKILPINEDKEDIITTKEESSSIVETIKVESKPKKRRL